MSIFHLLSTSGFLPRMTPRRSADQHSERGQQGRVPCTSHAQAEEEDAEEDALQEPDAPDAPAEPMELGC